MRARPREINIFNMSLLDILCGALGAFCFMMLVALPYYVGGRGGKDRIERQREIDIVIAKIEQFRQTINITGGQAEDFKKLLDELEAKIKQLEGQLNQLAYENDQLKTKVDELTNSNTQLMGENNRLTSENSNLQSENTRLTSAVASLQTENARLTSDNAELTTENDALKIENEMQKVDIAARAPFVVLATSRDLRQDTKLFLEDEMVGGDTDKTKLPNGTFDPNVLVQSGWQDDVNGSVPSRGVSLWVSARTVPKSRYRVFVRYPPQPGGSMPPGKVLHETEVDLEFSGHFEKKPERTSVDLAPERPWALAGTLEIDEKGMMSYKLATDAERADVWRAIMKTEMPTPTPVPTAAPRPSINFEELDRLRKMNEEERKKAEEQRAHQPAPSATPAPSERGSDMAERALRLRRAREAQSPAPVATPSP